MAAMTRKIGRVTREGHHAHTRIGYLNGGNPLANGGNMGRRGGGGAPRGRRGGTGMGPRTRSSY